MNINLNKLMELSGIQQIQNRNGLPKDGTAGLDRHQFDSLINSISSEAAAKVQQQYNDQRAENSDRHSYKDTIDKDKCGTRSYADVDGRGTKKDSYSSVDERDREYKKIETSQDQKDHDLEDEKNTIDKAVTNGAADEQDYEDAADQAVHTVSGEGGQAHRSGEASAQISSESEIDTAEQMSHVLFSDLNGINSNPSEEQVQNIIDGTGNVSALQNGSGNVGDEMLHAAVMQGVTGSATETSPGQNVTSQNENAEKGLKFSSANFDLFNDSSKGADKKAANMEQLSGDSNEMTEGEASLADTSLEGDADTDTLLNAVDKNSNAKKAVKGGIDGQQLSSEIFKGMNKESAESRASLNEMASRNAKSNENSQFSMNEMLNMEQMEGAETFELHHDSRELSNRILSDFAHLTRQAGVKDYENGVIKTVKANVDSNSNTINGTINQTTVKLNGAVHTGSITRPASLHELSDKMTYVVKGNNRIDVTVDHEEFGKLKIDLSLEKGLINVNINTTDKVVKEFVENNVQQIIDSLEKGGLDVGGFSVALKNQNGREGFGYRSEQGFHASTEEQNEDELIKGVETARNNNGMLSVFA